MLNLYFYSVPFIHLKDFSLAKILITLLKAANMKRISNVYNPRLKILKPNQQKSYKHKKVKIKLKIFQSLVDREMPDFEIFINS